MIGSHLPTGRYTALNILFDLTTTLHPGVNPYSARGLHGTLTPIDGARGIDKLARTVNGTLIDISAPQMRKYKLEITGNDQAPPALDGLFVGQFVIVDSLVEMGYMTAGGGPQRTPVPGSSRIEGDYSYYCPRLTMMIVELQIGRDEWHQEVPWSLTLEEI